MCGWSLQRCGKHGHAVGDVCDHAGRRVPEPKYKDGSTTTGDGRGLDHLFRRAPRSANASRRRRPRALRKAGGTEEIVASLYGLGHERATLMVTVRFKENKYVCARVSSQKRKRKVSGVPAEGRLRGVDP